MLKQKFNIIMIMLLVLNFLFIIPSNIYAYTNERLFDEADLFTTSEEQKILKEIEKIENKYDVTTFIITLSDNPYEGTNATVDYIELFGEENIGEEYIGFIIDMENRGYAIDLFGTKMFNIYTDDIQINIEDNIVPYLSDGDYYQAVSNFFKGVKDPLSKTDDYLITIGITGIISLIITAIMTFTKLSKHKEKKIAKTAQNYIDTSNLKLSVKEDRFIRTYTTKTAKQTSNSSSSGGSRTSTHSSSSGRSHSGRSGKF